MRLAFALAEFRVATMPGKHDAIRIMLNYFGDIFASWQLKGATREA
jgi:hypothetical protein